MTRPQRFAFDHDLRTLFGGNTTVSYGGVGVVALALSVLFELLARHQNTWLGSRSPETRPPPPDPIRRMFGANAGSDISSIASEFLKQIPGAANDQDKMAALLESYESKLQSRLVELYGRMVSPERTALSSAGVNVFPALSPDYRGLLIVEPLRNVSHGVHHQACERRAIQRALVERFLSDQNLQGAKQFFQSSHKRHDDLMAQQGHFQLSMFKERKK
ncbi:uncharacterized protein LOC120783281 [Xiphias gladius]|uniref:uncharacterized protein LOC120783281 n=1 Tax=Xiphias gladius TaxID=8245 RepID=UPI001A99240C|nr:uncharacterized protein LOC120783281 [Xiphias gladius]XP_039972101.1 uncharacterized protein LOC120783281 [Xiphias gladius]XP_039972110.1 uncharacterized protein LOC120783281 [Xiphias gladius]